MQFGLLNLLKHVDASFIKIETLNMNYLFC